MMIIIIMIIIIIMKKMMMVVVVVVMMMLMMMTMIIIIIIIIIIIMIIALKGANRDFCNLLTAPSTVSNTYAQVARALLCANHVRHIERLSRATCSVPLGTKGQLSY